MKYKELIKMYSQLRKCIIRRVIDLMSLFVHTTNNFMPDARCCIKYYVNRRIIAALKVIF